MTSSTQPPTIPLHCSICPKKPTFSDVSHLLTHVASKGHLSHYYKIKVKAAGEPECQTQIEAYDRWYSEWGVEELMSERMNLKEKKRTRTRATSELFPQTTPLFQVLTFTGARVKQSSTPAPDQLRRKATIPYDPRLSEHLVKHEHSPTPPPGFHGGQFATSFPSKMQTWASPLTTNTNYSSLYGHDYDSSEMFTTKSESVSGTFTPPPMPDPNLPINLSLDNDMTVSEASKLKGVYWPGMDIFDSATPEMKRKRNQKKDVSVLEQLENNSLGVEATELVWTPFGSFKKQKPISGSVTDSSPIKLDGSPKHNFLDRAALADLDPNAPRRRRRSPRKRAAQALYDDDEADFQEYLAHDRRTRKKTFDVYKETNEVSFANPSTLSTINSDYQPLQQTVQGDSTSTNLDFGKMHNDPFQTSYDGFHFDYQAPQSHNYFGGNLSYQSQLPTYNNHSVFQNDMSGLFGLSNAAVAQSNTGWMNGNSVSGPSMGNNSLGNNSLSDNSLGGNSLSNNSLSNNSLGNNSLGNNSLGNNSLGNNSLGNNSLGGNSYGNNSLSNTPLGSNSLSGSSYQSADDPFKQTPVQTNIHTHIKADDDNKTVTALESPTPRQIE
ncbi:hypothetical protein IWZ00DRAFT_486202 [Phyllosticta capitalensis]